MLLCHPVMRDYLINYARSLIYTTALGLPTLSMIKAVHTMLAAGATVAVSVVQISNQRRKLTLAQAQQQLWGSVHRVHTDLRGLPRSGLLALPPGDPTSPILSLCTSHPRALAKYCQEAGFIVRPIVPPTVPEGGQRVRICLHAGNTDEEVDRLVQCISRWIGSMQREASGTKLSERYVTTSKL